MEKEFTSKQLRAKLKEVERKEREEREEKKACYEQERNALAENLVTRMRHLENVIASAKEEAFKEVMAFKEKMMDYGSIRGGDRNKGSFEFKNSEDTYKVIVKAQTVKDFDERVELGAQHLEKFMNTFVKKNAKDFYELIQTCLQRNTKTGRLDFNNINKLYSIEEKFDHLDWKEALRLFKESYVETGKATYIRFQYRTDGAAWQDVILNFASL